MQEEIHSLCNRVRKEERQADKCGKVIIVANAPKRQYLKVKSTISGVATGETGGTRPPHLSQGPVLGFVQIRREVGK